MDEYAKLEAQLGKVRRRWRRAAALSGLALVLLESIGLFTLVVLLSLFYGHLPWVRVVLLAAAAAAVGVLVVRHIVLPLRRPIDAEQVALYVEEHNDEFEGSLITAAEFGRKAHLAPTQAKMVQAVVHVADVQAERTRLGEIISFARLRKYAVAAGLCLAVYVVMCAVFPGTVGRHVVYALQPWRAEATPGLLGPDGRPLRAGLTPEEARRLEPIRFELSQGDVRLARGADLELEALLSREPDEPVLLSFRPAADAGDEEKWQPLPMRQIEKLHGYARTLQSVSEDMEVRVSSGPYVSETRHITVYDPIELRGVEIATHYPEYLRFPDRIETLTNGDVAAPIGSKVTVRVVVNTPLASGKLTWEDGRGQDLAVDPQRKNTARASFDVDESRHYSFEVTDIDGQVARSLGPSEVFALVDRPPTVDLFEPSRLVETHPFGEVTFSAKATDDFGVERVELVCLRFTPDGTSEQRLPLALKRPSDEEVPLPEVVDAYLKLLLEQVDPPLKAAEILSWYLEAKDRKPENPPAASDMHMIVILPFEMWGSYEFVPAEPPEEGDGPMDLADLLRQTWQLHRERGDLKAEQIKQRCGEIMEQMVSPVTGEMLPVTKMPKNAPPRVVEAIRRAQNYARQAHGALGEQDTAQAVTYLRLGLAELTAAGITDTETLLKEGAMPPGAVAAGAQQKQASRLLEMFAEIKLDLERQLGAKLEGNLQQARTAEEAGEAVEGIRSQQQGIANQARQLAKDPDAAGEGAPMARLAQGERALAQEARSVAAGLKASRQAEGQFDAAADKIDRASAAMRDAAGHLDRGQARQAVTKAAEADKLLVAAAEELVEGRLRDLQAALAEAEAMVEGMLLDQQQMRTQTQALADEVRRAAGAQASAKQKRELKKVSFRQAKLKGRFEAFGGKMDKLRTWAASGSRSDTAKHVEGAHRASKRSQPGQKMANAVVELGSFKAKAAADEQRKAAEGLAAILTELQAAGDTLAATREQGLKRALREAKAIEKGVAELAGKSGEAASGKGDEAGGEEGEAASGKGDEAGGKGEETGGEEGEAASGKSDETGGEGGPSPDRRRQLGREVASGIRRLSRQLGQRDYGVGTDAASLQRVGRDPSLEARLVAEPASQERLFRLARRVSDKLEAELEATAKAKRILSVQREDCPPRYRHLVGKYYEALSKREK